MHAHEGALVPSQRNFIHLDFADFAIAVLEGLVDLGDLHALHDGLDCTTSARARLTRFMCVWVP